MCTLPHCSFRLGFAKLGADLNKAKTWDLLVIFRWQYLSSSDLRSIPCCSHHGCHHLSIPRQWLALQSSCWEAHVPQNRAQANSRSCEQASSRAAAESQSPGVSEPLPMPCTNVCETLALGVRALASEPEVTQPGTCGWCLVPSEWPSVGTEGLLCGPNAAGGKPALSLAPSKLLCL